MKSPWLWVIGGFVLLYILSNENNSAAPQQRATQYQLPPPTLPQSPQIAPSYPVRTPSTFLGYNCTSDCSGHEAGYQWAEDHSIDDPDDCGGNSESFIEGCRAYAEEQQDEEREEE